MKTNLDHRPILDLTMSQFERNLGDMKLYGTWLGDESANSEPCLCLVMAYRHRGNKPCIVPLSSAYMWREPAHAATTALEFCKCLGLDESYTNARRIADIITSHIPDLIKIPPRPFRKEVVGGRGFISQNGETPIHGEIVHRI